MKPLHGLASESPDLLAVLPGMKISCCQAIFVKACILFDVTMSRSLSILIAEGIMVACSVVQHRVVGLKLKNPLDVEGPRIPTWNLISQSNAKIELCLSRKLVTKFR